MQSEEYESLLGKTIGELRKRPKELRTMNQTRGEMLRIPISDEGRHVTLRSSRGKMYVNIGDYSKDTVTGEWTAGFRRKGINLTLEQWRSLMDASDKIEEATRNERDKKLIE